MTGNKNFILQISDLVTDRRCAVRIQPLESNLSLGELLIRYLKRPPLDNLINENRLTVDSAETLTSIQDLIYISTDNGLLGNIYAGIEFKQGQRAITSEDKLTYSSVAHLGKQLFLAELVIDRTNVGYDRNWIGFNRRRWHKYADKYEAFVTSCLQQKLGIEKASEVLKIQSVEHALMLVKTVARRIWDSDFENYSRFTGRKLLYKTGDETLINIIEGSGGICSEKVQALKFVTDHYGLDSEIILAGAEARAPVPESTLRELLTTFDFRYSQRYMRYWQHLALLYHINGNEILVDATNGNIPFLFLKNEQANLLLSTDARPVKVKMAVRSENFFYHKVSPDIPLDLLFAMEGWISDIDLVQVFDNELGLHITRDFMVTPIVFKTDEKFNKLRKEYESVCSRSGLEYVVNRKWDFDTPLGTLYSTKLPSTTRKILAAKNHLLTRYNACHGPGHDAGLIVIKLRN